MNRVVRMIILAFAMYASLMLSHVACSNNSAGRARAAGTDNANAGGEEILGETAEDYESDFGPDGTQLWIHGAIGNPQKIKSMNAVGGRGIVDLRTWNINSVSNLLQQYAKLNLGVCVTVRWAAPGGEKHLDVPPTPRESDEKLDQLMKVLTSPEAKAMAGSFWIQFYNELTGAGKISLKDADAAFEFATKAALRIRKEAPYILISGPAMTSVQSMKKDPSLLKGIQKDRYEIRRRMIRWSAEFADAIDLHLHTNSAQHAEDELKYLRELLNKEPNGANTAIIVLEWSPAHYPDRNNAQGIRQTIIDTWKVMSKAKVLFAAYACMFPEKYFGDTFGWQALYKDSGEPNEPFNKTVAEIGRGLYGNGAGDDDSGGDGDGDKANDDVPVIIPPLWVAGGLGSPERLVTLGAAGGRGIVDLRKTTGAEIAGYARDFRRNDLALCISLRWSEPKDAGVMDMVPPANEARPIVNSMIRALKSKDSVELGERFWIQILNEVAGEVGQLAPEEADKMFDFATTLAERIKIEAPHIKICGPALTDTELFELASPSKAQQDKIDVMNKAIRWSIKNAAAIDVHIPGTGDYDKAKEIIAQARKAIDAQPGGSSLAMVCWQFDASKYTGDHDDVSSVRAAMYSVWRAVAESSIIQAAYNTYSQRSGDVWTTLVDNKDKPHEPFYSTFMKMVKGDLGNSGSDADNSDGELKETLKQRRIVNPGKRRR